MTPEQKLAELGLTLPQVPVPVANYVPFRIVGDLLYLSGQGPKRPDGTYRPGASAATPRSRRATPTPSSPVSSSSPSPRRRSAICRASRRW